MTAATLATLLLGAWELRYLLAAVLLTATAAALAADHLDRTGPDRD